MGRTQGSLRDSGRWAGRADAAGVGLAGQWQSGTVDRVSHTGESWRSRLADALVGTAAARKDPSPESGFQKYGGGPLAGLQDRGPCRPPVTLLAGNGDWHRAEISARGQLGEEITQSRFLIIGAGAIGSVLSELLARAGVRDIAVLDPDRLEVGNLVRHTLLSSDIGRSKALGLGDRLTDATVQGHVSAVYGGFPPVDEEQAEMVRDSGIIIDTTGEDAVPSQMDAFEWGGAKTFISVSLGIHARRLFFFAARDTSFPSGSLWRGSSPGCSWSGTSTIWKTCPGTGPGAGIRGTPLASTTCG